MPQNRIITAIDVGTEKCTTLIASHELEKDTLRIMGVSVVPSKGMKKSQIVDLEDVLETVTESLDGAERMAGLEVKEAFISIGGQHINSQNSRGVVAVSSPDQEIVQVDVDRVIEAAQAISLSGDQEIIHVIAKAFKVDSQDGIKDPVGMTGVRLESEAHIITGMATAIKNLEKCIVDLGIGVRQFVFSGLASSQVVLTETEKELGVAVLDIGAGTSSFCVYVDGSLEFSGALPIGARYISLDIAQGCKISFELAEEIKLSLSEDSFHTLTPIPGESKQDFGKRKKKADELKLSDFAGQETDEIISKKVLVESIMLPRIQEIFELFIKEMKEHNLLKSIPAGVVLSGGGAQTIKITEIAKRQLNLPVRIGYPEGFDGLINDIQKPSFATSVGLLVYGKKHGGGVSVDGFSLKSLLSGFGKFGGKKNIPRETSGPRSGGASRGKSDLASQGANKVVDFIKSLLP